MKDSRKYDAIINLPHHSSTRHAHMAMEDRAAQFSPFAALTGHEEAIGETARLTEEWHEMDEDQAASLDERLQLLYAHLGERPTATFTYFEPDAKKEGGAYRRVSGRVVKILDVGRMIVLEDGKTLPLERLVSIEGELFSQLF